MPILSSVKGRDACLLIRADLRAQYQFYQIDAAVECRPLRAALLCADSLYPSEDTVMQLKEWSFRADATAVFKVQWIY